MAGDASVSVKGGGQRFKGGPGRAKGSGKGKGGRAKGSSSRATKDAFSKSLSPTGGLDNIQV
jgi:hypothetical protein